MPDIRRNLLSRATVAGPLALAPAAALAPEADPHPAWAAELREVGAFLDGPVYEALPDAEADGHPAWARWQKLQGLIGGTPARTLAGVREQVWLMLYGVRIGCGATIPGESGLRLAVASLDRLAGKG